jgi:hypothetical protein
MEGLPVRGDGVTRLDLPLPPGRMPLLRKGRPLKRWRYVGVYGPDLMLCVGRARVGVIPKSWWAVVLPGQPVREGEKGIRFDGSRVLVDDDGVRIDLLVEEAGGVESVNAHERSGYIWTRKQAGVPVRGHVELDGRATEVNALGAVDDTAGYHARHTSWLWSAGVGRGVGGERVGWNLVTGVNDGPTASERTVWVDGEPVEVPPSDFAPDLSRVDGLDFTEWPDSARVDDTNLLLFSSRYRQPFGSFSGVLPNGLELAEGWGVMESHDVKW